MFGLGNPNSSIYVFLAVLSWVLWFGFGWKFPVEKRQKCHFCTIPKFPPRRKKLLLREELCLGEPEALKFQVSTSHR